MKNLILSLLLSVFSFSLSAQLTYHSMDVNGVTRQYYKYLPVNYQATENLPVVFILHGLGGNAQQMTLAGFQFISDTARIIAIYPDALPNAVNQTAWNNGTLLSSTADDISFFNKMMDLMINNQNANPSRIYVTGFSMGGIMSHHLACALNSRIAAIGPMAGTMSTTDIQTCVPVYKTPVIHLHGTADGVVPYDSNALPSLSLVPETMNFWRNVHGCSASADSTRIPDIANDSITVDRFVYDNCNPLGSVELWRLNGADHIYLYQPVNDITEAVEIWKFFNKWQHPNPATVNVSELPINDETFTISPNPSNGEITVNLKQDGHFILMDIKGNTLKTMQLHNGSNNLKLVLSPGVYLMKEKNGSMQRIIIR
jgi:polyhydroxybutyrate depolymerase